MRQSTGGFTIKEFEVVEVDKEKDQALLRVHVQCLDCDSPYHEDICNEEQKEEFDVFVKTGQRPSFWNGCKNCALQEKDKLN